MEGGIQVLFKSGMWCAPKLCTTPVLRTGAGETIHFAPVYLHQKNFAPHQHTGA